MNWPTLAVALAVSLLLWLPLWTYVRRKLNELKPKADAGEKEARVFKLYQEIESMLDSFDQYVDEVHKDLEEERAALTEISRQSQIVFLQAMEQVTLIHQAQATQRQAQQMPQPDLEPLLEDAPAAYYTPSGGKSRAGDRATPMAEPPPVKRTVARPGSLPEPPKDSRLTDKERQTLTQLETKAKRVRFLMSRGFAVDEVARELGIGIGEVRLIADLER